jgi:hypothetical protein
MEFADALQRRCNVDRIVWVSLALVAAACTPHLHYVALYSGLVAQSCEVPHHGWFADDASYDN